VWKRAIADGEERLAEMNRIVSEKMSHQQRLIDRLQQYVRVQDNLSQHTAAAAAAAGDNKKNTELLDDDEITRQQDALSAQLSNLVNSLKAMTANSVQVSSHLLWALY